MPQCPHRPLVRLGGWDWDRAYGVVAQLGARLNGIEKVGGSSPPYSTRSKYDESSIPFLEVCCFCPLRLQRPGGSRYGIASKDPLHTRAVSGARARFRMQ